MPQEGKKRIAGAFRLRSGREDIKPQTQLHWYYQGGERNKKPRRKRKNKENLASPMYVNLFYRALQFPSFQTPFIPPVFVCLLKAQLEKQRAACDEFRARDIRRVNPLKKLVGSSFPNVVNLIFLILKTRSVTSPQPNHQAVKAQQIPESTAWRYWDTSSKRSRPGFL